MVNGLNFVEVLQELLLLLFYSENTHTHTWQKMV